MVLPILLLLFGAQDNSQLQSEVNRLQGEVHRLSSDLKSTQTALQNELRPVCSTESRFQAGDQRVTAIDSPVLANLFGMVSTPSDCLPADIRITATYFDSNGGFVCSGTTTIPQSAHIQNTTFEFRPYLMEVFLKWWDGATLRQQALVCRDYQGTEMRVPTNYAESLRIFATIFPKRGGMSTAELKLTLPQFLRP